MSQTFYGSIGWAFAATLGVDRALEEKWVANGKQGERGRAVCITGDGAMALSIQEAGTIIWEGLRPVVLLVNNFGYLVERVIHGPNQRKFMFILCRGRALFGKRDDTDGNRIQ